MTFRRHSTSPTTSGNWQRQTAHLSTHGTAW